ncbi:MAG: hypothetical protein A3E38_02635 [Candidatus Moranbacteria bacterium RIFCSPHIGHO2_12_FULL_54_9]|nr:MAG: hypothetical protein A3E38_02635 [Candidatus Moranbacteria bacterium RIFCSPHIGHO2_12_FULL_54_9]
MELIANMNRKTKASMRVKPLLLIAGCLLFVVNMKKTVITLWDNHFRTKPPFLSTVRGAHEERSKRYVAYKR